MHMRQFARRLLDPVLDFDSPPAPSPQSNNGSFGHEYHMAISSNDTDNTSSYSNPTANPYAMDSQFSPSMAIILVVLLSAFFFMGFFSVYVRRCTTDDDFNTSNPRRPGGRRPAHGLDQALVDSLPLVTYSAVKGLKEGKETTECVVCLSEFEDNESLRLLPQCQHSFHQDCIDMWLFSHTTCPLCRRSLLPQRAGDSNGVNANLNEDVAAGELTPAREVDAVEDTSSAPGVEVAITIRDNGMQGESSTGAFEAGRVSDAGNAQKLDLGRDAVLPYYRFEDKQDPAAQDATGCGSPIFGVMESSPSACSKSEGRIRRGLSRSHSTGHSLVKRAFNRANFLLPASSDQTIQPSSSGAPTVGELHRSRSYTMLFDHWPSSEGTLEWEDDSGLDPLRGRENSKGWNFSFRRALNPRRSSQEARLYPTLGDDYGAGASSSARGTFDRLASLS